MNLLSSIPKECLNEIWNWLPGYEIKKLAQVCKELWTVWNAITRVEFLRFTDPNEIRPLLKKHKFVGAKSFKLRRNWKLKSSEDLTADIISLLKGKQLTSLDLDCRLIPNPEELIRAMTSLERVCLYEKKYDDADPTIDFSAMFPNHPNLRSFSIKSSNFIQAQGWECVKNLEYLELSRNEQRGFRGMTPTSFEFPESHLSNLKKLRIQLLSFDDTKTFKNLTNLVELETIHVKIFNIEAEAIDPNKPLFDLPNLKSFHWQRSRSKIDDATVASVGCMTNLTKLIFSSWDEFYSKFNDMEDENDCTDFNGLNTMTNLKQLAFFDRGNVSGLTNIEKLRLSHSAVPFISFATDLPKLVDLSLTDMFLDEDNNTVLTALCSTSNLTKLHLRLLGNETARLLLLDNISKLRNLQELEIAPLEGTSTKRSGEIFNAISSIASLRMLTLSNAAMAAVPEMAKLTQLQFLKIGGKPQYDTCQIPLKDIPIEYYAVMDTDVLP